MREPSSTDHRLPRATSLTRKIDVKIRQRRLAFYSSHLLPHIPKGSRLLDVGAGDGLLAEKLSRETNAHSIRAFDIERCTLGQFEVEQYNGRDLPLEDASIDVTTCVTVLHHCDDAARILSEIRRVTTKKFLLVEDRYDSWWGRVYVLGFHYYLRLAKAMPFDRHGFNSSNDWHQLLQNQGFRVVDQLALGRAMAGFPINTLIVTEPA